MNHVSQIYYPLLCFRIVMQNISLAIGITEGTLITAVMFLPGKSGASAFRSFTSGSPLGAAASCSTRCELPLGGDRATLAYSMLAAVAGSSPASIAASNQLGK